MYLLLFFRCAVIRTYFLAWLEVLTVIHSLGLVSYFRAGLPSRFHASGSSEASETKKDKTPKKKNKKDAKEDTHTPGSKGPKTDTDDEDDKPALKRPAGKGGVKLIDVLALTWRHRFFLHIMLTTLVRFAEETSFQGKGQRDW